MWTNTFKGFLHLMPNRLRVWVVLFMIRVLGMLMGLGLRVGCKWHSMGRHLAKLKPFKAHPLYPQLLQGTVSNHGSTQGATNVQECGSTTSSDAGSLKRTAHSQVAMCLPQPQKSYNVENELGDANSPSSLRVDYNL